MNAVHVTTEFSAELGTRQNTRATDLLGSFVGNEMMANLVGERCELKYLRFVCDEKRSTEDIVLLRTERMCCVAFCLMRFALRSARAHKKEH